MRERPVELEMDCYDTEGNFDTMNSDSVEKIINVADDLIISDQSKWIVGLFTD